PLDPEADFHCSRIAQPSEARLISLVPTSLPCGLGTFHRPNQKSNCRSSAVVQVGDGEGRGALPGLGDAAHKQEHVARPTMISREVFIKRMLGAYLGHVKAIRPESYLVRCGSVTKSRYRSRDSIA